MVFIFPYSINVRLMHHYDVLFFKIVDVGVAILIIW